VCYASHLSLGTRKISAVVQEGGPDARASLPSLQAVEE